MPRNVEEELRAENAQLKLLLQASEIERARMPFDLAALGEMAARVERDTAEAGRRRAMLTMTLSRTRELLRAARLLVGQLGDLVHSIDDELSSQREHPKNKGGQPRGIS